MSSLSSSIKDAKAYFSRPRRITQTGASRFYFYNHRTYGRHSINFISPLIEPAIRQHLQDPIPAANVVESNSILRDLERDGIAFFPLSKLYDGESLFAALSNEWATVAEQHHDEINEMRQSCAGDVSTQKAGGTKPYTRSFTADALSKKPHWRLALHPDILHIVNSYMSAYARVFQIDYMLNVPMLDKTAIKSQVWHRDGDGTVLKLFVYFNDVTEKNGPFVYAPGTHASPFRQINYKSERPQSDDDLRSLLKGYNRDFVTGICKKGTALLANTSGMHKGGHVLEGERHALLVAYYPPWIERDDYGLKVPGDFDGELHPAQRAAILRNRPNS